MASKLARFHAMSPPLPKDYDWAKTFLINSAKKLKESPEKWRKLFKSYECKALLDCDISSENEWLLDSIPAFDSPIVYGHNDLRFQNLMISDDNEVILSDFEDICYYPRGYDFALLFDNMDPNKEVIKEFITEYLNEGNRIFGKTYSDNAINSVDHILKEMEQFTMVFSLLMANLFLYNDIWHMPINEKTCMVSYNTMSIILLFNSIYVLSLSETPPWPNIPPSRKLLLRVIFSVLKLAS